MRGRAASTACKVTQPLLRNELRPGPVSNTFIIHRRIHVEETLTAEPSCKDEMRLGQKNGLVRQWARRGSRPRQPADQRYESTYLFGAICPARGVGAALVMPRADTAAMQRHLDEIARSVKRRSHAVLLLDRAAWHTTGNLVVPNNMTLIFLPSRAPELNPVENIWQYRFIRTFGAAMQDELCAELLELSTRLAVILDTEDRSVHDERKSLGWSINAALTGPSVDSHCLGMRVAQNCTESADEPSTCAPTGSRTASSTTTRPSSMPPARPGTSSSPSPKPSRPSACGHGHTPVKLSGHWY